MLAQRYPTQFDGIAAGAPGINWNDFFPAMLWPYRVMNALGEYPHGCELQALTAAAVAACDELDGVADGVIADAEGCRAAFDPFDAVGIPTADCPGAPEVSRAAAAVVNATWQGPISAEGARLWPGLNPGTDLAVGVAATDCTGAGGCEAVPLAIAAQWMSLFVARDSNLNLANLSHAEFDWLAHQGRQRYDSIMGTRDPDLSAFRNAGGKIITFHGLVSFPCLSLLTSKVSTTAAVSAVADICAARRASSLGGHGEVLQRGLAAPPRHARLLPTL